MRDDFEFNIKLCEIVQQHPIVYDCTKPDYCNKYAQDKTWREIGLKIGATVKDCKERWKNIRNSYAKYKKKINSASGSATKPAKEYYLAPYLPFLDNFLKFRTSKGILELNIDRIEDEDDFSYTHMSGSPKAVGAVSNDSDFNIPQPTIPLPEESPDINLSDANISTFDYFSKTNEHLNSKGNVDESESEADMAFFRSMLPDIRTMSRDQKRKLKIGVLNLIEQILKEPGPSSSYYSTGSVKSESPYHRPSSRESE